MSAGDEQLAPRLIEDESERRQLARTIWLRSLLGSASARPEVDELANRMKEVFFPMGSHLYRAGESSDRLYFIVSGSVVHGREGLVRFASGDALGFVDSVLSRPHVHDALVEDDAIVLELRIDDWFEFLEENFEFFRQSLLSRSTELPPMTEGFDWGDPKHDVPDIALSTAASRLVDRLTALQGCPLLERAGVQSIAQLVRVCIQHDLAEGQTLRLGSDDSGIWIALRGVLGVEITQGEEEVGYEARRGTLLGGLTILDTVTDRFDLVAVRDASVLHIPTERMMDVMEDHFDLIRSILAYMAAQVEAFNRAGAKRFGVPPGMTE